jgi:hypothetical protein
MAKKSTKKDEKKEEVKVVDEVTIEETIDSDCECGQPDCDCGKEEVVEEDVEEVVEEVVEEKEVEVVIETPKVEKPKTEGKGKVVKLTQKTATFEDGTVVKIVGRKQHAEFRKLRK